jgi:NAD-dependent deacetylase
MDEKVLVYYIDPKPATIYDLPNELKILPLTAVEGMKIVKEELVNSIQKTSDF